MVRLCKAPMPRNPLLNGCPSARDELEYQRDHSQYEQDVNEASQRVAGDDAQQPQNQKDYEKCPKHISPQNSFCLYSSGH